MKKWFRLTPVAVGKKEGEVCYTFYMRQKSTVYSPSFHNQFGESKEELLKKSVERKSEVLKDKKQGQSEYRIKEATKKQSV
ncbi:MAG: hypothetical protein UW88_C0012G0034 [Candidatus Collierbacteria bacterium GW2011_GWD2_45_10]|uniref:Uncharacterized protein n=1 Tax=Candidatus Collierbacteria bacterium GW2011_GWB2_44_22 TaxID=1618387 RepID=A0A0G1HWU6_9BACT|nr:MAG: hypothetical protein UW31_C0003G0069 [Candidatus Collierbacteria bacterium GW2011_GWA2_44_13]KKT51098.1 MAG: hypothetical protein UW44_C0016G0009 [Candidatus Collierbacteria bacterium GW2011_GWB2_44_22]KKT61972.1 MAG: hypothetical protein UW56_C0014G0017 [Candidatus Collierbacteria bacterium GW2011_GWD1_44_27]KKT65595.1 MAG: hypothetical protein UW58_C0025G0009 [Candidatus Collierbacteria bacterium GW2011_GWC2_44_30]KKT88313.1 MAG: hypothetical protein UW88_C0012G0034 [Candidatus Collie